MFKNGDVICFLGDSITAAGTAMAEIYQHIRRHTDIKCYNCGVSGASAELASEYLYDYCLYKKPTHVVIMFGANDIKKEYYAPECTENDKQKIIENALCIYSQKMEFIIQQCLSFGAKVILCTPPPYDEITINQAKNLYCQSGLEKCAKAVKALSRKYELTLIDLQEKMLEMINTKNLISEDRIHPTTLGYHVIAQLFLLGVGETDKLDFDTPYVIEKWNRERQSIEKTLKLIDFIDYVVLYRLSKDKKWTLTDKINEVKKRISAPDLGAPPAELYEYFALCYKTYLTYAQKRDELEAELIRRTPRPY